MPDIQGLLDPVRDQLRAEGYAVIRNIIDPAAHLDPIWTSIQRVARIIVAPEDLRPDISTVIVALNPAVARSAIANVDAWKTRTLRYVYLD